MSCVLLFNTYPILKDPKVIQNILTYMFFLLVFFNILKLVLTCNFPKRRWLFNFVENFAMFN